MAPVSLSLSLSSLPPELLCRVFQSAEDFSVVAALSQTARIFYRTWRENPTSICAAVAPRVISNLADAQQLVDIQEVAEDETAGQPNPKQPRQDGDDGRAIFRAKRLLFNARCTSAAYDSWVSVCSIHKYAGREEHLGKDPHMRPSERARFEHAFYCLWTVGVMARATHLQEQALAFLDRCSPRELTRLEEMSTWARYFNENDFRSRGLDLDLSDETWRAGSGLVYSHVSKRSPDGHGWSFISSYRTPLNFVAFFDHTQERVDRIPDHW